MGSKAACFLMRMVCRLSTRWDRNYAEVLGWIRVRLAFAKHLFCVFMALAPNGRVWNLKTVLPLICLDHPPYLCFLCCFCCVIWFLYVLCISLYLLLCVVCVCVWHCVLCCNSNNNQLY